MKRVASPGSMHDTGCLGLVHWDDPEGWYGEGGGRRVQDGEHMYTCGGFIFIFLLLNFIFKLYKIVLVLPNIKMNPPQVYMCSPSWTLLPPPSPYHPSGSSQCTSPKHPVSCIEPGLVTRFIHDIIHVSMPFSQIFPPSPSPAESIRLFYTSVSLLLRDGMGREEGGRFRMGNTCIPVADSFWYLAKLIQFCKV